MKLQQLTESNKSEQSTLRSELTKKEMVVLELRKETEVGVRNCYSYVYLYHYILWKHNPYY